MLVPHVAPDLGGGMADHALLQHLGVRVVRRVREVEAEVPFVQRSMPRPQVQHNLQVQLVPLSCGVLSGRARQSTETHDQSIYSRLRTQARRILWIGP